MHDPNLPTDGDLNKNVVQAENAAQTPQWQVWLKRMGVGGFLFFLIKGVVLYILLPYLIAKGLWK